MSKISVRLKIRNYVNVTNIFQCPPCRGFTPELVSTYNKVKEAGKNFEIIFVSSDRDEGGFKEYWGSMPWLAIPFGDKRKNLLSDHFEVEGRLPLLSRQTI